jgi:nicotinate (nicotinamide) nucleotide adenylyltransferase
MKIALYLGSFNPFHNGHLECIKKALNDFKMDKVVIVPTMQNPWKEEKVLDIDIRKFIIYWSIKFNEDFDIVIDWQTGIPSIYIDLIEKELIPPYYSYATLHALKNKYYNDEIFILCGEDTIKDIPNWMNGEAIIKDYNFLIVDRPKNSISSSSIREMLRAMNKMDAYYSDEKLSRYVPLSVIALLKKYYA